MRKVLALLTVSMALAAAAPIDADPVWEAEDRSLTMISPDDGSVLSLRDEPDRLLPAFLAMIGAQDADAKVTEQGLSSVREDVSIESVTVNGELCYRSVKRRIEVVLDFVGVLSRMESEEYGQAYSVADHSTCDMPPTGISGVSFLPGTWRMAGEAAED